MTMQISWLICALVLPMLFAGSRRHTVTMSEFQFAPREVRVSVGDTVVWENRDVVPHTATADDASFDSGNIPAKAKRSTVARKKGEFAFTCLYHSNMKGKLVVK
jgi:plastocyanin